MSYPKFERRIKFDYVKSIVTSFVIPLGYLGLWYIFFPSTTNEFLLLTHKTKITTGFVTKAEQIEDRVDLYEGRKSEKTLDFNFEYTFSLSNGRQIVSFGSEPGPLPDILSNVNSEPYPIIVEYLPNNPETNRVKASWTGEKTLFQWFRKKVVIGLIVFLFCCFISVKIFKDARKNYKAEMLEYNKWLQESYSIKIDP